MKKGLNNDGIQKNNRGLVLELMLSAGAITRAEIARTTGLKKATITNIINEFEQLGIVAYQGASQTEYGRPGELISLRLTNIYVMSLSITRKNYKIFLYNIHGKVVEDIIRPLSIERDIYETIGEIKDAAGQIVEEYGKSNILQMCIAMPGPFIKKSDGTMEEVAYVTKFEQLSRVNVREEFEKAFDIPLITVHDAKLAAYAEWKRLEANGCDPKLSLVALNSVGIGLGGGIVINGKIVHGVCGIAGEIGHMGINYNESRVKNEMSGSYEKYAGIEAVVDYALSRKFEYPESPIDTGSTYSEIIEAYINGDELATWAMEKLAWMVGYGIVNLIYVLNPDCIIIGNDYPDYQPFLDKIVEAVSQNVYPYMIDAVNIKYSELGQYSMVLGGYHFMLDKLLNTNRLLEHIKGTMARASA